MKLLSLIVTTILARFLCWLRTHEWNVVASRRRPAYRITYSHSLFSDEPYTMRYAESTIRELHCTKCGKGIIDKVYDHEPTLDE